MRSKRLRRALLLVAGALTILLGLGISLWLHYQNTPDFDSYVRTRPVSAELVAARLPAAQVLSQESHWRAGDVDPFGIAEADPAWRKHSLRFTVDVFHGEEVLATVVQELGVAADRASGDRASLAVGMHATRLDPRMRVVARIWLDDESAIGPGSAAKGRAIFDVMVVAGAGANEFSVARCPSGQLPDLDSLARTPTKRQWPAPLNPWGAVFDGGLIHHVRRVAHLAWTDLPSGSSSAGFESLQSWMSTDEYSYLVRCEVVDAPGFSSSSESGLALSWNGKTW